MPQPAPPVAVPGAQLSRLRRRPEFLRVSSAGRRFAAPGLVLQVAPRLPAPGRIAEELGVGYTVSRKVGGAVQRNRARRRLRAVVQRVMPIHAQSGFDYVLVGRSATVERPFPLLLADLEQALRRLGLWRADGEQSRGGA
ncbi:MAG: ribonuclease P protein component [Alphaproteobacteria bacterium]|nr:ribonuclease P protein component [Alphaproteobacteria bacterium]